MLNDKVYEPYESVGMYADMIISTRNIDEIEECMHSEEVEVRRLIASNKNLNYEQLEELSKDNDEKTAELAKLNIHYQKNEELNKKLSQLNTQNKQDVER